MLPADRDLVLLGEGWQVGHTMSACTKAIQRAAPGRRPGRPAWQGLDSITLTEESKDLTTGSMLIDDVDSNIEQLQLY